MRKPKTVLSKVTLLSCAVLLLAISCSDRSLSFGKWIMKAEPHEYVLLTEEDARTLGEVPPAPFPSDNKKHWTRVKEAGIAPSQIKPTLKPYSIVVIESGYTFLQSTRTNIKGESLDDIEWGWKIILENRSKRTICAYSGYSILDKDGFVLAAAGIDWDSHEDGVCIKAGQQGIIQGRAYWQVSAASNPYPPSRVHKGDYKLFLRQADVFDEL